VAYGQERAPIPGTESKWEVQGEGLASGRWLLAPKSKAKKALASGLWSCLIGPAPPLLPSPRGGQGLNTLAPVPLDPPRPCSRPREGGRDETLLHPCHWVRPAPAPVPERGAGTKHPCTRARRKVKRKAGKRNRRSKPTTFLVPRGIEEVAPWVVVLVAHERVVHDEQPLNSFAALRPQQVGVGRCCHPRIATATATAGREHSCTTRIDSCAMLAPSWARSAAVQVTDRSPF
jgi:hypothetical protein